jgi:hypothetical protein
VPDRRLACALFAASVLAAVPARATPPPLRPQPFPEKPRPGVREFDQAAFKAVVQKPRHQAQVRRCFERHARGQHAGRIIVRLQVKGNGRVSKVSTETPPELAPAAKCLRLRIKQWRFPGNGEEYEAEVPFAPPPE